MDESGQASAEFILLFGGIIVVVLLAVFMYRNYVNDLSGEIKSKEVSKFNEKLGEISDLFT
ncbi:class III signal peptide-containing protein [Methanobrevibacter millerae]|uniref:Class III signal peptide n=1 Tax=Methanobrevibacter millerae TaxID=230361 RepID=A0A1G5VY02_9EURY|nr:class III signal peptide-containing protein [Methanobrevibacter millerae]SDA50733.1 Class III signal peptide [Methanobrevibacter millerae]